MSLARCGVLLLLLASLPLSAATGTHLEDSTLYPRLIRLTHAAQRGAILAKTGNRIFRSVDEGRSFTLLARVPTGGEMSLAETPDGKSRERCCSTLYEVPQHVGALRAGTLLYAASFFSDGVPAIELFVSTDTGAHWKYWSTPIRAGDAKHGLWEPEFTLTRDGSLAMFVSDETNSCCSQKLVQLRTRDGRHWSAIQDTVASGSQADRPGMAVVTKHSNGSYFMSYEICGPTHHCAVYARTSGDGWNFGDPADPGVRIQTASGAYLAHAPTNTLWRGTGAAGAPTDRVVVAGQMLINPDGSVSTGNGRVLLERDSTEGGGAWRTVPAPVEVPAAYDNYCPNYSSALLPVNEGRAVLELASDYDASHQCTSYFAIGELK